MERNIFDRLTEHQVYLGYDLNELNMLEPYINPSARASEGFYTDFSGVKTRLSYFGLPSGALDKTVGAIPFPDDGVHAECIEYLAAVKAVNAASSSFTAVELGAGYGPWLTFSANLARKKGIQTIKLLAVEADLDRHVLLKSHLGDNSLPIPDDTGQATEAGISTTVIYGAISDSNGEVSFGSSSLLDWGAAPIEGPGNVDYRGFQVPTTTVRTYTIEYTLRDVDIVDFLHIDIQGFEYRSIKASINAIKEKVRFMLIATHSRKIEGELFGLLFDAGWRILHEKPCRFSLDEATSLESLTTVDGTQLWVNTALVEKALYVQDAEDNRLRAAEYRSSELEKVVRNKNFQIILLEEEILRLKRSPLRRIARMLRGI